MAGSKKKDSLGFEESLKKLEEIVEQLEDGSLTLEESLKAFEEGMALYRKCVEVLGKSRNRVETLLKQGEELVSKEAPPEFTEVEEE